MINKDTQLCISIANEAGNFGTILHNSAYRSLDLNFIYKSFAIKDLPGAIKGVRALGIRGCSVSAPFKQNVIGLLDDLDSSAEEAGSVNTIVNNSGRLRGYNTDIIGAKLALLRLSIEPSESILIMGGGGVARAILVALRDIGCTNISVACRDVKKGKLLNSITNFNVIPWSKREEVPSRIVINATSIGMPSSADECPLSCFYISGLRGVMDVVPSLNKTRLIYTAMEHGIQVVPGYIMSLEQAAAQFNLYTGCNPPKEVMEKALHVYLKASLT